MWFRDPPFAPELSHIKNITWPPQASSELPEEVITNLDFVKNDAGLNYEIARC